MAATIHAILLIAFPILTAVVLRRTQLAIPSFARLTIAVLSCALWMAMAFSCNHHLCNEGVPHSQWLIGGLCTLPTLACVKNAARRRLLAAIQIVAFLGLSCQFTDIVHTRGWTGNPEWEGTAHALLNSVRGSIQAMLNADSTKNTSLPRGWIRELPTGIDIPNWPEPRPERRVIGRAWHSWLTGLYPYTLVDQDYWYPGGKLSEAASRIELRDRPRQ